MPATRNNPTGRAPPKAKAKKTKTPTTTKGTPSDTNTAESSRDPDMGVLYFWKPVHPKTGYLSQWYWLPFYDDQESPRKIYKTAEHYMMHHKALLFGDDNIGAEILEADDPKLVKSLGRAVQGFNDKTWNDNRERIVERGNYCKFSFPIVETQQFATSEEQPAECVSADSSAMETDNGKGKEEEPRDWELGNAEDALVITAKTFREVLLQTGNKELVEASPMDRIWGVGFGAANAGANRGRWGLNLLGKCLMRAREQFREEEEKRNA